MEPITYPKPPHIDCDYTVNSPEFRLLTLSLTHSSIVALDAEWKPSRTQNQQQQPAFPTVSLLQIACRLNARLDEFQAEPVGIAQYEPNELVIFLVDLQEIDLAEVHRVLKEMFDSPDVLKLGFRFKQDLIYLSSTLGSYGGFEKVEEPFMDVTNLYSLLQPKHMGRRASKDIKSLATIRKELLGLTMSKELQCSDWSYRPLTEEQKVYAAIDAHCLLEIFAVFLAKIDIEGPWTLQVVKFDYAALSLGLKDILKEPIISPLIFSCKFFEASDLVRTPVAIACLQTLPKSSCRTSRPMDQSLYKIVRKYGSKVLLKEADKKPRPSRRKGRRQPASSLNSRAKRAEALDDWQGPPPWDLSLGGNGSPRFLCDVMVEGLAKHLRCVGVDAAVPYSRKPDSSYSRRHSFYPV